MKNCKSSIYKQKKFRKSGKMIGIVITMLLVIGGISSVAVFSKGFHDFSIMSQWFNNLGFVKKIEDYNVQKPNIEVKPEEPLPSDDDTEDKVAPVIGNFIGQDTPTKGNLKVTFSIVETGSSLNEKTCTYNGHQIDILNSGNDYCFWAECNGEYTITATDYAGNKSTAIVKVIGIDTEPPVISEIMGANTVSLFDGKIITFKVTDLSKEFVVKFADKEVKGVDGIYSIRVYANGKVDVEVTDKFGNSKVEKIDVTNCYLGKITTGSGVTILSGVTPDGYINQNAVLKIKIVADFGYKVVAPTVLHATVVEDYNYGLEAEYIVTFDGYFDYNQTINANNEAMKVDVVVNGNKISYDFGSIQTFTANDPTATQVFVGWFNSKDELISTNKTITVTITSANTYTAKYNNKE